MHHMKYSRRQEAGGTADPTTHHMNVVSLAGITIKLLEVAVPLHLVGGTHRGFSTD